MIRIRQFWMCRRNDDEIFREGRPSNVIHPQRHLFDRNAKIIDSQSVRGIESSTSQLSLMAHPLDDDDIPEAYIVGFDSSWLVSPRQLPRTNRRECSISQRNYVVLGASPAAAISTMHSFQHLPATNQKWHGWICPDPESRRWRGW